MTRSWYLAALLVFGAACSAPGADDFGGDDGAAEPGGAEGGGGSGGGAPPPDEPGSRADVCALATDCEPAGTSCCDCPTFAVPVADGWGASCEDVGCPAPDATCAATEAACVDGACVLRCAPVVCDLSCADGFAIDQLGCLSCACAEPMPPGAPACESDDECARVPADCCGCEAGGADTAVPMAEVDAHYEGLDCDAGPICPGVNVCDPDREPRCMAGRCALAATASGGGSDDETPGDPQRCGASQLPQCAPPARCTLNLPGAESASDVGLGVCQPP